MFTSLARNTVWVLNSVPSITGGAQEIKNQDEIVNLLGLTFKWGENKQAVKNKIVKVSSMRKVTQGKGDRQNREGRRPLWTEGQKVLWGGVIWAKAWATGRRKPSESRRCEQSTKIPGQEPAGRPETRQDGWSKAGFGWSERQAEVR